MEEMGFNRKGKTVVPVTCNTACSLAENAADEPSTISGHPNLFPHYPVWPLHSTSWFKTCGNNLLLYLTSFYIVIR